MTDTKCCKKPKCNTTQNKCLQKDFMFSPMFWKLLAITNILIIILRVSYLNKFNFDLKLLYFLLWLELQIIAFYILLISAVYIYKAVYKLFLLDKSFLISLFSKRYTNRFMKWLTLINTDNIFFRLWCILCLFIITTLISFIVLSYLFLVFLFGSILIGYTKF
jgi:hypothetical protein